MGSDTEDGRGEKIKLVTFDGRKKKEYDADFKGPIENRGCTDIICCVLFGLYMCGMVVIGIVAFIEGNPRRLLYPTNSAGKICGRDIPGKPYLYFFDLTSCLTKGTVNPVEYAKKGLSCPTPQVCVKSCPNFNGLGFSVDGDKMVCVDGVTVNNKTSLSAKTDLVKKGKCAAYYIESKPVFYRCLPSILASQIDKLALKTQDNKNVTGKDVEASEKVIAGLLNLQNIGIQVLNELESVWYWILVGLVLAMLLSLIYIVLSRWLTLPIIIASGVALLAVFVYGIYYCFYKYKKLVDSNTSQDIVWKFSTNLSNFTRSKDTWMVSGIVLAVVFLILFLILIFLIPRVVIACALISEASRAVCSMLSTLFFPILPWIIQIIWFFWFIVVLLCLASNGSKEYRIMNAESKHNMTNDSTCNPVTFNNQYPNTTATCLFSKYVENIYLLRMQIVHLFGWLWGANFLIALGECTLAGAFASYYWARRKPEDIPSLPVLGAFWRSLVYHSGSLALGAAIVAIIKLIRIILEYLDRKLNANLDNPVAKFIIKCLKCCFWCLEKCIRFLNKNAYIMVAIYGKNFCASAKEAFWLLARNPIRLIAISGVTGFLLFLGKLLVVGIIGIGSFYWFDQYNAYLPDKLNYSVIPILLCVIGAYIVTVLFFNVYDMGIDTIFLCFLEDLERHDGSDEKPYFMTSDLKRIMDVKNKPSETTPINQGEE